jgi:DNA-binding CsgD family transcriptional regulator/tetratricopeptide (TPR) repeat protein
MELLERAVHLEMLGSALAETRASHGRIALVSGEAGIGKTSLVTHFTASLHPSPRVLWGVCDDLFTPRPLGPLFDVAAQAGPALSLRLEEGSDWLTLARALLADLERRLTLVVFEDVHWADTATLDLLKFLGRRIQQTKTLLILTYRDDEVHTRHPLQILLGDLASSSVVQHIPLAGLSAEAVRILASNKAVDADALHRLTNGNPFFITAVLSGKNGHIPATVRDAVLARVARLSPDAQQTLEAAAIIGTRIEPWLLFEMTGVTASVIEECLSVGLLRTQKDILVFQHELARQVILEATSPPRKLALHRLALNALSRSTSATVDLGRLTYHADVAGDGTAVLKYALAAARQARAANAPRETAAHYARALKYASGLSGAEHAALLEGYAEACGAIGQNEAAIEALQVAARLREQSGELIQEGHNLSQMAQYQSRAGQMSEAIEVNQQAIAILETQPASNQLAWAYGLQAGLEMVSRDIAAAVAWGEKAIAMAERLDDVEILATNYIGLGSALMLSGNDRGRAYLEWSISIARGAGLDMVEALATTNLVASAGETYRFELADRYLNEGLTLCREREFDYYHTRLLAWQAISHFYQGRWEAAEAVIAAIYHLPEASAGQLEALVVMARLQARRGDPCESALLDQALDLATQTGLLQDLALVRAARAESAWLAGDLELVRAEAGAVYDLAVERQHPWFTGELAYWRWRAGEAYTPPDWAALAFARQIQGDWQAAADAWQRLGCPYEQACALADGDHAAQLTALTILEELPARPAAQQLRHKLRAAGVRGIPRGPRPATRTNPFGLTPRQMDVLQLLKEGLTNSEIAARLSISPRTAEHHVAAILSRLGAGSREEAIGIAQAQDLNDA